MCRCVHLDDDDVTICRYADVTLCVDARRIGTAPQLSTCSAELAQCTGEKRVLPAQKPAAATPSSADAAKLNALNAKVSGPRWRRAGWLFPVVMRACCATQLQQCNKRVAELGAANAADAQHFDGDADGDEAALANWCVRAARLLRLTECDDRRAAS